MKIICFIDSLCSGGAQTQLIGLGILFKQHLNCEVVIATYHSDNFRDIDFEKNYNIRRVVINKANVRKSRIFRCLNFFVKERPDWVISYLDAPNIIACCCHMLWPHFNLIVSERNTSQYFNYKMKMKYSLYRQAKYVVANSYTQTSFIQKHVPTLKEKIATITNFVDLNTFSPKKKCKSESPYITITVAARINHQKNPILFIKAIKSLIKSGLLIKVKWYGRTDSTIFYEECLNLIDTLGLKNYFSFCGESKDMLSVYGTTDIFCLPSTFEGFPNVICEAMSCGLPIACSNVCDNSIIVEDGVNGTLFSPFSDSSIAEGLTRCIALLDRVETVKVLNMKKMKDMCSDVSFINKYITLIKKYE